LSAASYRTIDSLLASAASGCDPLALQLSAKKIAQILHETVLRRKRWATSEMTANSNKRWIKKPDTWKTKNPPIHASNKIANKMMNM
jgi:hypothetical protein